MHVDPVWDGTPLPEIPLSPHSIIFHHSDAHLQIRCGMVPLPFDLEGSGEEGGSVEQQLSAAVKVLLLTNPNNPLSTMYKRETLVAALRWCLEREVHVVR